MDRNNSNDVEVPESEKCIAFFVPTAFSAFVVEIMECAFFKNKDSVRVAAGALQEMPRNVGVPLSMVRDRTYLPELNEEKPSPKSPPNPFDASKKRLVSASKKRLQRWKYYKMSHKRSKPESQNHCCQYQLAEKMEKKYGKAIPQADGTATAPRLLVQYPGLPYLAPICQKFKDLGTPRGIVDFSYTSIFTPDAIQDFPMVKTEPID